MNCKFVGKLTLLIVYHFYLKWTFFERTKFSTGKTSIFEKYSRICKDIFRKHSLHLRIITINCKHNHNSFVPILRRRSRNFFNPYKKCLGIQLCLYLFILLRNHAFCDHYRDQFLHSHHEWEGLGFMWKMTFEIFIKSLRFETPWVRKKDFYESVCLSVCSRSCAA